MGQQGTTSSSSLLRLIGRWRRLARSPATRRYLYHLFDDASTSSAGPIVHGTLTGFVLLSVAAAILESVVSLQTVYGAAFTTIEVVSALVFTVEYILRLWVSTEHPLYRQVPPVRARLHYIVSPWALIDLVAILPLFASAIWSLDLGALVLIRLFRFLKLARYSPSVRSLAEAIYSERRALGGSVFVLLTVVLLMATVMHLIEGRAQPEKFGNIPQAMYWAVITVGTVGYGDVVPITPWGKFFASITALLGYVMLAVPVGIVGTAFAQAIQRREFVVTWSMVARVPLFAELAAVDIAEIMRYLRSLSADQGETIVRKGEIAHSMYFIAMGEVEVDFGDGRSLRLGEGHFFGEIAVLQRSRRTATVRALAQTKLMVLDAGDLRAILDRNPQVAQVIENTALHRKKLNAMATGGDLTQEEFLDAVALNDLQGSGANPPAGASAPPPKRKPAPKKQPDTE
jgi:voltage-gated potassium channel